MVNIIDDDSLQIIYFGQVLRILELRRCSRINNYTIDDFTGEVADVRIQIDTEGLIQPIKEKLLTLIPLLGSNWN